MKHNVYVWVGASLVIGALSFYANGVAIDWPPLGRLPFEYYPAIRAAGVASNLLWLTMVIAAPFFLRWRALWLLVSLPLVLFWPYVDYRLIEACAANSRACL